MYLTKTPGIVKPLYSNVLWHVPTAEKVIYLTFDDGPIPDITPAALEILAEYDATASFFCVGENVQKHSNVLAAVVDQGHTVGHHTYHHSNGWKTSDYSYFRDVLRGQATVATPWFRPPYGKIKRSQLSAVKERYNVVLWDVLSADFDTSKTGEYCANAVCRNAKEGSIVVFHDSIKAADRMLFALPKVLQHFSDLGYRFGGLDELL